MNWTDFGAAFAITIGLSIYGYLLYKVIEYGVDGGRPWVSFSGAILMCALLIATLAGLNNV